MKYIRIFLGIIFIGAVIAKLFGGGSNSMFSSLPGWMQIAVATAEFLVGSWLVSGVALRWSSTAAVLLFSIFLGAIAIEIRKDNPLPCGCLGAITLPYWGVTQVRTSLAVSAGIDAFLMLLAGLVFFLENPKSTRSSTDSPTAAIPIA